MNEIISNFNFVWALSRTELMKVRVATNTQPNYS